RHKRVVSSPSLDSGWFSGYCSAAHQGLGKHESMVTPQEVLEELKKGKSPGFSRDIVSFGMIRDIEVGSTGVNVILAPGTAREEVVQEIRQAVMALVSQIAGVPAVQVSVTAPEQPPRRVQ